METSDTILKSVNVNLLVSKIACPRKFLLILGGDVGAVQQAIATGTSLTGDMLADSLVLSNIRVSTLPAISGLNNMDRHQAVDIVEIQSVIACICAANWAVKASNVMLVHVHTAPGIGGKCYMAVTGDVFDVNNAVTVASESAGEKDLLVYRSAVPCSHESMWRQMVEG